MDESTIVESEEIIHHDLEPGVPGPFGSFSLGSETQRLLAQQRELTEFGLVGRPVALKALRLIERDKVFEVPQQKIERSKSHHEIVEQLINPRCFEECKLPSTLGLLGDEGSKFEKPLFEQSLVLRRLIFPVFAMCAILEQEEPSSDDFQTLGALATTLRNELSDNLRNLHLRRLAAKVPDKQARQALLAGKDSMLHSSTAKAALDDAKRAKKMAEALAPKKTPSAWKSFRSRGGGGPAVSTPRDVSGSNQPNTSGSSSRCFAERSASGNQPPPDQPSIGGGRGENSVRRGAPRRGRRG